MKNYQIFFDDEKNKSQHLPKVYNKNHKNIPDDAVYIGRGSKFGSPYVIGRHGNRDQCCDKYKRYVMKNPQLIQKIKTELKGKNLLCFCKPLRCHGDFLIKLANS